MATVSGNTSPVSLTWSGPGLPSGFVGTSTTVAQEGAYTVKTQVNGCLYSATTQVTVVSPPNPPTISGWVGPSSSVVAAGTSLTLIASGCPGTINWYAGNTLTGPSLGPTGNLLPITVNQTQSYYARCVDGQGCSSPASATTTFVVSNTVLYNGQYRGYVDVPSCGIVYGWAANQANPTTPLKVSIFIDNAERSQMYTDWYRQDAVCNICECSACPCPCSNSNLTPYGISWPIPDIYLDGQPHTLGIKIVETGQWLISTTMSMSFSMAKLNTPTIVGPANTTLTANSLFTLSTSSTCAGAITWHTAGGSIATGSSITLSATQSQTYFARCQQGDCSSPNSNSIAITMAGIVITPANSTICSGSPISLTALGCSQTIVWQNMTNSTTFSTTGSVLTTGALTVNTTINAKCGTIANAPVATALITVGTSSVAFTTSTLCSGSPQSGRVTASVYSYNPANTLFDYQLEDLVGNVVQPWVTLNSQSYSFPNVLADGKYVVRVRQRIPGQTTCPASATVSIACDCGLAVSGLPISNSLMVGSLLSLTASMNTQGQLAWNGPTGSQFFVQSPTNTSATSYSVAGNVAYLVPNAIGSFTIRVQQPGVATCYKDLSLTVRPYACACTDCNLPTLANTDNLTIADAATITQNFVKEITFLNSAATQFQETISYIDGLGRPMQQVQLGAGGAAYDQSPARYQDIISVQEYDAFGRQPRNYLPYTDDAYGGSFRSGASLTAINNYYNNTLQRAGNAYTGITYEASALSRVLSQTAPGSSTAVTMVYRTNTTTDAVKLLTYVFSNSTISVSTYATNQLLVTETTNENGQKTVEFKDRDGRLVCREVAGLRTYYAFDDLGRLRCVVPPLASSLLNQASFAIFDATNDLVFAYDYDERGRLIRKKIPGAGVSSLGYDLRDRLTSSTDAKGTTIVTTYDDFDRVTSTSIANGQLLTQHFYDSYSYAGSKSFDLTHAYSQTALTNSVRGMATGTKVWGLGNASSLTLLTTTYYDGLGRVIQTQADNHLGGVDKSSSKLDFVGRGLETKLSTQNGVIIETRQSYDPASRLKAVCQRVTDNASALANTAGQYWEPIARHNYNPIGELTRKTLGCSLQNLDYTYQMRGWLTGLNQPTNLAQANDCDLFGMSLGYDGVGNITTWNYRSGQKQPLYGGALSQNALMAYSFGYDTQNRLTNASLTGGSASFSLNTGYDSNGNITSLSRVFNGAQVDNLSYSYAANSNRLSGVTDAATSSLPGFFGANASYTYDANGNLLTDSGKGITSITYNVLNLPQTVPLSSSVVSYTYTATGQKLRATFPGNKQYDYVAGLVYEGGKLEFIPTAEGRILPPGRAINPTSTTDRAGDPVIANRYYRYEYQLKDHLGNLRVACRCPEITTAVTGSQLPGPGDTYPLMVMQEEQYDPWGLSLTGLSNLTVANGSRFKYNSKEEQQGLGWIDYGARFYDPMIGRWNGIDPLAEKSIRWSPFVYGNNNPIRFTDPDGRESQSTHTDRKGNVVAVFNDGDLGVYRHNGNEDQARAEVQKNYSASNTAASGEFMGNTLHALSFVNHRDYNRSGGQIITPEGRIDFGSTWAQRSVDNILSDDPSAFEYASKARTGQEYDVKTRTPDGKASYGSIIAYGSDNTPIYASARDAGNFAAGAVAARSAFPTNDLLNGFGAYNLARNNALRGALIMIGNYLLPVTPSPLTLMPTHGEDPLTFKAIESGLKNHKNYFWNSLHGAPRYTIDGILR